MGVTPGTVRETSRYCGSALTMPATFTFGVVVTRISRAVRRISISAAHAGQPSMCAITRTRTAGSSDSFARSGSLSRISTFGQSIIEKLLHRSHRVVIVHSRGALGGAYRVRDLLVRQPFTNAQREYFALRRR